MNNFPLISIVFITYKRIELLKKTIDSFLKDANYPNLELILCDDGSPEHIQKEMKKFPFDKFLFSKKNEGMGANTNKGIKAASADFIFQLQDDWIYTGKKDFLEKGIEALLKFPDLGIVRYRVKDCEKFLEEKEINYGINKLFFLEEKLPYSSEWAKLYSDTPHLKRKSLHEKLGFYLEAGKMEKVELDFCQRISEQNIFKVAYIDGFKDVFGHIGEDESFRKRSIKNRISKIISKNKFIANTYRKIKDLI